MNTLIIDLGLKRIGLALCIDDKIALPLDAIFRKNRTQAANEIKQIIINHNIKKILIGIPLGGSSEDEMQKRIKHFINLLDFKGEIIYIDESYTSKEANRLKSNNTRKKDGKLDSLAAFIMAKDYFKIF